MAIKLNLGSLLDAGLSRADMAALRITQKKGGIEDGAVTPADNQKQFEEYAISNLEAQDALRGVEELRQQIAGIRSANDSLVTMIDELRNDLASSRNDAVMLRTIIDDFTVILSALPTADQFRNRIESIEDRLA